MEVTRGEVGEDEWGKCEGLSGTIKDTWTKPRVGGNQEREE